ncbi:MAG: hypothetical protein GTO02_03495, partial [Candidatus Dadabacteria bacterium]|nr:hypothetical protein [Candidatus Dadabacteria bacterium]
MIFNMVVDRENEELNERLAHATVRPPLKARGRDCEAPCAEVESEKMDYGKITQWTTGDGKRFVPAGITKSVLPPGV